MISKGGLGKHFTGGTDMLRNAILITCFGLIVGGCASDRKIETMDSSGGTSSTAGSTTRPADSSPTMSSTAATESNSMSQSKSSRNRIAAGIEEETLDSCLAHIPKDATVGQKMLAEQTCRRDYSRR